jgi:hypothetical protein
MRKRWTAAAILQAERQFRQFVGYRDLATLVMTLGPHAAWPALPSP